MNPVSPTPWSRIIAVAVGLAAVVSVIVLAFLWPTVTSSVSSLPIAVVAPSAQAAMLESQLEERAPGSFVFQEASDRDAAVDLIETRAVYGAIVLGPAPEILTASAASPAVAQVLGGLAPVLGAGLAAAAQAQGQQLPEGFTVAVTDVVALAATDSRGIVLAASSFPVVIGGLLGGILISLLVMGAVRRVTAVLLFSVVGAAAIVGILQGWFGALQGSVVVNAAAVCLALLAISAVLVGLTSLFGRPGIPIGVVIFLLVANPLSAAAQPVEFLAAPWGAVGQWFPPGAAATLLRELSYFPRADMLFPWLVLAGWATAGLVLSLAGHVRRRGAING